MKHKATVRCCLADAIHSLDLFNMPTPCRQGDQVFSITTRKSCSVALHDNPQWWHPVNMWQLCTTCAQQTSQQAVITSLDSVN
jgi:hypothetical protein